MLPSLYRPTALNCWVAPTAIVGLRGDSESEIRAAGRAVLLATHDMDEAEQLCDRIAVIAGGRTVATGTPADLIAGSGGSLEDVILKLTGTAR